MDMLIGLPCGLLIADPLDKKMRIIRGFVQDILHLPFVMIINLDGRWRRLDLAGNRVVGGGSEEAYMENRMITHAWREFETIGVRPYRLDNFERSQVFPIQLLAGPQGTDVLRVNPYQVPRLVTRGRGAVNIGSCRIGLLSESHLRAKVVVDAFHVRSK